MQLPQNANTRAPFEMMLHATPHLIAAGVAAGPSIIAISSVNGKQSFAGLGAYCGSKAAIDHIARCGAVDLAPHGIRVNNVNPGVTITPLQKRVSERFRLIPFTTGCLPQSYSGNPGVNGVSDRGPETPAVGWHVR
jgi:NAD(P)-dependent dehydrogenase (short-subunit alcohol dehydrogenase family)